MTELADFVAAFWGPFEKLAGPQGSLYWLFLASSLSVAVCVYWSNRRGANGRLVSFLFPKHVYAHSSSLVDVKYFAFNTVLFGVLIGPILLTSAGAAQGMVSLLVSLFGVPSAPLADSAWMGAAVTAGSVIAADFAFFISHRLRHEVPFLWEFHKVHHSAEVLQPLTAFRNHPVADILDLTLMSAASGGGVGIAAYASGAPIEGVMLLGANALVFAFYFSGVHLRHSHVWLSYGPVFDRIFVSPAGHQIHHSLSPQHFGKNLGGMFAVWDWMAGTLYVPREREELTAGLPDGEDREYGTVRQLYLLPFVKIGRRLRRARSST